MSGEQLASPGAALAKARENAGITQREVADALHLPITTIDAIEDGDATRLPAKVFTRGYVRAYAKLLELDPEPLIAALGSDHGDDEPPAVPIEDKSPGFEDGAPNPLMALASQPRVLLAGVGGVVVLVILLVFLFGGEEEVAPQVEVADTSVETQTRVPEREPAPAATAVEPEPTLTAAAEPSRAIDDAAADRRDETIAEVTPDEIPDPPAQAVPAASEPDSAVVESVAASPVGDPNLRRLTAAGGDRLSLVFSEDCWVEIKDTEGNQLYGDLGRAGDNLDFVGAGPFRVLLGYAPGAILIYNDEPVALSPHTRNNVASLVIGQ